MVTATRAGSALRRASIFQHGPAYLHALRRRLCSPPSRWDQGDAQLHLRWLADGAGVSLTGLAGPLPRAQRRELLRNVLKLRDGMPLAYILQTVPFADLELSIRPPTLIPRPETEEWAVRLASLLPRGQTVLDLCTGSGAIGLYLAHATDSRATLVDVSPTAIELARENVDRLAHLHSQSHQPDVQVLQADLFAPPTYLTSKPDLVVCNPPYITPGEYEELDESVRSWEDQGALLGVHPDLDPRSARQESQDDRRGLAFYRRLAQLVPDLLQGGAKKVGDEYLPQMVLEIGHTQAAEVVEALRSASAPGPELELKAHVWQDMGGKDRVVVASWVQST